MTDPPRLVVLGHQGAGKGTQCSRLAEHLDIAHVSTGDLFRAAVRAGSPTGRSVASFLDRGELVPDELTLTAVEEHLSSAGLERAGYLLDGFPRTVAQAEAFCGAIDLDGPPVRIDAVLALEVPVETVAARIRSRRACPACGWTTLVTDPATVAVPCDDCAGTATQREDDHDDAVRRRLALYDSETGPLTPWFAARGLLVPVDGDADPELVFDRILAALAPHLAVERVSL
ncbi:adenylate kinase [soil metagenome]